MRLNVLRRQSFIVAMGAWLTRILYAVTLSLPFTTSVSAGQFEQLASAKYVFVGFVNEAKLDSSLVYPLPKGAVYGSSASDGSRGDRAGCDESHCDAIASVLIKRKIIGSPKANLGSHEISICVSNNIAVGESYLFIVGEGPRAESGCLYAISFLLGAPPHEAPNSSIVLTEDMLEMMPVSPRLYQHAIAMPDAIFRQAGCEHGVVVLNTYFDLHDFVDLLRQERVKKGRPEQVDEK